MCWLLIQYMNNNGQTKDRGQELSKVKRFYFRTCSHMSIMRSQSAAIE